MLQRWNDFMKRVSSTVIIVMLLISTYPVAWADRGSGSISFIQPQQTLLDRPVAIEIDNEGNMYVTDYGNNRILKLDSNGGFFTEWGEFGSGDGQFNDPSGIAIDNNANVYVADKLNHRIQKFDSDGNYLSEWGRWGNNDGEFRSPVNIAINHSDNTIYVTDQDNNRVQKFDSNGHFLSKWGSRGNGDGEFNNLYGIAIDQSGHVYVTESENHRIQKFDSDGTYMSQWGSLGNGNGQFQHPFDIAIDSSGHVYVPDALNNRIQKFDSDGTYISQWGSNGNGNGQFNFPNSVGIDSSGNVYVTEALNHRIQKFDPNGDYLDGWSSFDITPSITPNFESFDKNEAGLHYRDVNVTLKTNGYVLFSIMNGATTLIEGSDYLRAGNTVTIKKEYLTTLPLGQVIFTFDFGVDTQLPLTIDISNSTPILGAPHLQPAIASDEQVSLTWSPVDDATSYKIYQSLSPSMNGTEVGTVVGSVYDYTATGLVNGTTYYFTVRGENVQGESPASNIVSATPFTVPGAPTNVVAVPSNRQATITFDTPAFDGGSPITEYEVTVYPGGHSIIGASSPIVVTGLTNGEAYTFTVKANNAAGSSVESAASDSITPSAPPSGGDSTPPPTIDPEPQQVKGVDVWVNGKRAAAGTVSVSQSKREGRTVLVVALNQDNLAKQLASVELGGVLEVHVSRQVDEVYVELSKTQLEFLGEKQVLLELQTIKGTYRLPIEAIGTQRALADTEKPVTLQEFKVRIGVGAPMEAMLNLAESVAEKNGFTLLSKPVDFTVQVYHGSAQLEVLPFDRYVERLIKLPEGTTANQMTTAIVLEKDGAVRHVPTKVETVDGQEYAVASSLTNSTYALISHPLTFRDVQAQWAKEAVNDLGARLIVEGDNNGLFHPKQAISRAEFAAILIRSLGLKEEDRTLTPYSDVTSSVWYSSAIHTGYVHNLISGFEDGTFRPTDKLTREQAMMVLSRAIKLTGLKGNLPAQVDEQLLASFTDASEAGQWALSGIADSLQAGIVTGRDGTLAPKAFITRAEVAVMIQRLLRESSLID